MRSSTSSLAASGIYIVIATVSVLLTPATVSAQQWEFDTNSHREGWAVPDRLTGVVMGGSLWLTLNPKETDPQTLASLEYQVFGDYNILKRMAAGEKASEIGPSNTGGLSIAGPASVDIVSPSSLGIAAPSTAQQLQVTARVLNLSPATNVDFKWRSSEMVAGTWASRRCNLQPDLKQWQAITCFIDRRWRGTVDQIALGVSENIIRGDLWIDWVRIAAGPEEPVPVRPDVASVRVVPTVAIPGLSQRDFADAFQVLDEALVVEVPAYGFPYPFMKPGGDNKYGEYWWQPDAPLSAAAAAWVNQPFADNVMRGFHQVQALNPDGRISGNAHMATHGQPGDYTTVMWEFFESAYAIAVRSSDTALRAQVYATMSKYLDWYLSPHKRDQHTGLVTGTFEEAPMFPPSRHDFWGFAYLQSRAPVSLNVGVAVAASRTADLAIILGHEEAADRYRRVVSELTTAINTLLWDETDGMYYDYDLKAKQPLRYRTAAMFFPLRLGIAPKSRQQRLLRRLTDPAEFNWGKTPLPNIALTEESRGNSIWALTNTTVVQGLVESGRADLAADLNWSMVKLFHGNYREYWSIMVQSGGAQRYGFTAASYIRGVIEHLFGIQQDLAHRSLRIVPHVPRALYGKEITLTNLIVPTGQDTRMSVRVKQTSRKSARITVSIAGPLPEGQLHIELPGHSHKVDVPIQRSFSAVFR